MSKKGSTVETAYAFIAEAREAKSKRIKDKDICANLNKYINLKFLEGGKSIMHVLIQYFFYT